MSRVRIVGWVFGVAVLTAGLYYLYRMDPHQPGHYPGCPFFTLTGFYCPGCGSLRTIHCVLHGRFADAASRNILALILLPVAVYAGLLDIFHGRIFRIGSRTFRLPALPGKVPLIILVVVVLYWILRNLPWFPFNLLAPQNG